MTASDLPECEAHRSNLDMARALVTYLDDPKVVRQAILREFARSPTERTIRDLREHYLASRQIDRIGPALKGEDPRDCGGDMERRSKTFLIALDNERELSRAMVGYLSRPDPAIEAWAA